MARGGRGPSSSGYEKEDAVSDYYQAVGYFKLGWYDQALTKLFKAATVLKDDDQIVQMVFEIYFQRIVGHMRSGIEHLPKKELTDWENYFRKLDPKVLARYSKKIADVYYNIYLHLDQINDPTALVVIKKAREFDKDSYDLELFLCDAKCGNGDDALHLFETRPEIFGEDVRHKSTVFDIFMKKARDPRTVDGKRFAEKAMELDYVTIDSTNELCLYFVNNNRKSNVKRTLLRHLKRFPDDLVISLKLGFYEYVNKNYKSSMDILAKLKKEGETPNIEVVYGLGLTYEVLGKESEALAEYREVVSHPQFCSVFFQDFIKSYPSDLMKERLAEDIKKAKQNYALRIKEASIIKSTKEEADGWNTTIKAKEDARGFITKR